MYIASLEGLLTDIYLCANPRIQIHIDQIVSNLLLFGFCEIPSMTRKSAHYLASCIEIDPHMLWASIFCFEDLEIRLNDIGDRLNEKLTSVYSDDIPMEVNNSIYDAHFSAQTQLQKLFPQIKFNKDSNDTFFEIALFYANENLVGREKIDKSFTDKKKSNELQYTLNFFASNKITFPSDITIDTDAAHVGAGREVFPLFENEYTESPNLEIMVKESELYLRPENGLNVTFIFNDETLRNELHQSLKRQFPGKPARITRQENWDGRSVFYLERKLDWRTF